MSTSKELYQAYRQLAIDRVREDYSERMPGELSIGDHAHVMPTEDGAFVELQIFVPRTLAEAFLKEREQQIEACGAVAGLLGGLIRYRCTLTPNHEGYHRDDVADVEWAR